MSHKLRNIQDHSGLYRLESDQYLNNYYIISNEQTCRLMASPEVAVRLANAALTEIGEVPL